ncbi:MAG: hypothetical protein ABSG69_06520 [Candidatus Acidiferrum sp.]|jgi:hypothetical protein
MTWISPAQFEPDEGLKSSVGTPSVAQPELLAAKLPYEPMLGAPNFAVVVAGIVVIVARPPTVTGKEVAGALVTTSMN